MRGPLVAPAVEAAVSCLVPDSSPRAAFRAKPRGSSAAARDVVKDATPRNEPMVFRPLHSSGWTPRSGAITQPRLETLHCFSPTLPLSPAPLATTLETTAALSRPFCYVCASSSSQKISPQTFHERGNDQGQGTRVAVTAPRLAVTPNPRHNDGDMLAWKFDSLHRLARSQV